MEKIRSTDELMAILENILEGMDASPGLLVIGKASSFKEQVVNTCMRCSKGDRFFSKTIVLDEKEASDPAMICSTIERLKQEGTKEVVGVYIESNFDTIEASFKFLIGCDFDYLVSISEQQ